MKHFPILFIAMVFTSFAGKAPYHAINAPTADCDDYMTLSTCPWDNSNYRVVMIDRTGNHLKAKYFAAKDFNNNTVFQRFNSWKSGKQIILASSGTYMDDLDIRSANPVGLCIDNGVPVNQTLSDDFDGLVIVQATGGIAVSNLEEGNLSITCEGQDKKFDIRNAYQRSQFIECAKSVQATVFQTHLLAYRNQLLIKPPDGRGHTLNPAPRRFLAACKDRNDVLYHIVIHVEKESTLYDASTQVFKFLQFKKMKEIVYMLNLDTGAQNAFELYDCNGNLRNDIKGSISLSKAINLLVYYYQ